MMELTDEIKDYAKEIGFDIVGVTDAEPFKREEEILKSREKAGMRSSFEPSNITVRCDPRKIFPPARSILSLGLSYANYGGKRPGEYEELRGWISSHALGRDYHHILREKMASIVSFIRERDPEAQCLMFVDSGSPMERAIAARAGLGWIGKNCSLISGLGPKLFLGEIFTSLPLTPDEPNEGSCGDCTLCLQSCPTGALEAPYVLNPHRCLSEITQRSGYVPSEYREKMENRLYGCDECVDACPYGNRSLRKGLYCKEQTPPLLEIVSMSKREFDSRYGETAIGWRGRTTIQRNAVIALGNSGQMKAEKALTALLDDRRPVLRGHAAWALGRLQVGRQALTSLLNRERDPLVRKEIEAALRSFPALTLRRF